MDIEGLMQLASETNRAVLRELIVLKSTVGEKYLHPKTEILHNLAAELISLIEASKDGLGVNDNNYAQLDAFFLKTLYGSTDN